MVCSPPRERDETSGPMVSPRLTLPCLVTPGWPWFYFNVIACWTLWFYHYSQNTHQIQSRSHWDRAAAGRNAEKQCLTFCFRQRPQHPQHPFFGGMQHPHPSKCCKGMLGSRNTPPSCPVSTNPSHQLPAHCSPQPPSPPPSWAMVQCGKCQGEPGTQPQMLMNEDPTLILLTLPRDPVCASWKNMGYSKVKGRCRKSPSINCAQRDKLRR